MSGTIPRLSDVDAAVVGWGRHFKMTLLVQYREGFFVSPLMITGNIPRPSGVGRQAEDGWGRQFQMTHLAQYEVGFFVGSLVHTGKRTLGFDERSEMGQLSRVDPAPRAGRAQYARHSPLCPP